MDAELSHTRSRTLASGVATSDEANGAVSSFELDLFGRNQSLSRAARETACQRIHRAEHAPDDGQRADHGWVTLAADNSNLALAKSTRRAPQTHSRL